MWVGARTVEDRLSVALRQAGFEASVVVFHCDEVDAGARARLAGLWNLTDRAVQLRNFHHRLFAYIAAADIDRHESAWRCVEAAPIWYRIAVQDEPPFPIDICASDYPLEALNQAWRNHLESMTEHLTELWAEEGR
jgi:DNA-binding transcriptional regulator PaaX